MADDLVKRLRDDGSSDRRYVREAKIVLQKERSEAADRIETLEAKLAKAVAALRLYDRGYWLAEEPGGVILNAEAEWPFDCGQHAAAVLAEVETEVK